MESIREGLLEAEIPSERVHWESLGGTGNQPPLSHAQRTPSWLQCSSILVIKRQAGLVQSNRGGSSRVNP